MNPRVPASLIFVFGLVLFVGLFLAAGCEPSGSGGPGGAPNVPAEATEAAQTLIELKSTHETRQAEAFYPAPMYGVDRS